MTAIAEKIRKLIAKADSSTHPEEAETFMAKARALMEDHGISLLDLGRLDTDDPVGVDRDFYSTHKINLWRKPLLNQLSRFYGCKLIYTEIRKNMFFHIAGRESARVTTSLMWPYVDRQVQALALQAIKEGRYDGNKERARRMIGNALTHRIADLIEAEKENAPRYSEARQNALVPVDMIQAAIEEEFGELSTGKARRLTMDTFSQQQAEKVSLYRQTDGAGQRRIAAK